VQRHRCRWGRDVNKARHLEAKAEARSPRPRPRPRPELEAEAEIEAKGSRPRPTTRHRIETVCKNITVQKLLL